MTRLFAFIACAALAAEHQGIVKFGGLPVPGLSVVATRGERRVTTITDPLGTYTFADLADGVWTLEAEMQLFAVERREVTVSPGMAPAEWSLRALPPGPVAAVTTVQRVEVTAAKSVPNTVKPTTPDPVVNAELASRAVDGFLINGSVNNGSASVFAQLPAFGNHRRGQRSMYNGSLGFILNNAAFDARSYSLTGQNTAKPAYNRLQGLVAFGGPLKIGNLLRNGPLFTVNYQWTRNSNANTQTGLMPTAADRRGDFSQLGRPVLDPDTGLPFPGNVIPERRLSPQARMLLGLYPLPNFTGSTRYNYQLPIVSGLHQDDLQTRASKQVRRNFFAATFSWQSTRTDTPDLFGFLDTGRNSGLSATVTYRRSFTPRSFVNAGVQLSRFAARVTPYFANRRNVSAEAEIAGNNREPLNWGPPNLDFASGLTALSQDPASLDRNQTSGLSVDAFFARGGHNLAYGGNLRRQHFNVLAQQNPRGTFAFTGATTGSDIAGFLLGIPDTSSIAFGNADKYLRGQVQELFANDDWRVNPGLTINVGMRWEYWSPLREKYGRLVNLEIAPGFGAATPSSDLPRPDRNNFAPRFGLSWRPFSASSMVVRGGYGLYYDTSVYQPIALRMSQQAPLSTSLRIANSGATPLTLANGFPRANATTDGTTFGVDPEFRMGYSQNWQVSLQRDLPGGLQLNASYNGVKGTRSQQQYLPNTFPAGAIAPSGFTYLTSNGNSARHAGQMQLRRRLRSGLTASATYAYAKAIDNAALGGRNQSVALVAQNWLDLRAERARSNFDQRHLLATMVTYTTGMGLSGGGLATGKLAGLLKEWTVAAQTNTGTGLPLTPVFLRAVPGTGVTGSIRPDATGASVYAAPPGFFLNPSAYTSPAAGRWGNAGRNSITGPRLFVLNASLARTFRSNDRLSYDFRVEAANALNYVTFPSWNTVVGNAQFGLPTIANPMRSVQVIVRARF